MKKVLIFFYLILSMNIYSTESIGQIYNLEKRGTGYQGSLDGRLFNIKENTNLRIVPSKDIEILKVNGSSGDNGIYEIKNENIRVDFRYKSQIVSTDSKILIGTIEYLDNFNKTEFLFGEIAVEFRKKGKIDMKVKGELDFGVIPSKVSKEGILSKKNAEITINLSIDKKDIGNTKLYFQYPSSIEILNSKVIIQLDVKENVQFSQEKMISGRRNKIVSFLPKNQEVKEKITLTGKLYSTIPEIPSGNYKESITVKAFYEYLDYSIEKKDENRKVVIRR